MKTRPVSLCGLALTIALLVSQSPSSQAAELLPPGFRPLPLGAHALTGGKVVVKPGEVLDSATIIIRDGLIKAVGKDLEPPPDARVWDMRGTIIYAGFIDPYLVLNSSNAPVSTTDSEPVDWRTGGINFYGAPGQKTDRGNAGPGYELSKITPEFRVAREYSPVARTVAPLREAGFTAGAVAPTRGVIRGTSVLVTLGEDNPNDVVLRPDVFQHIAFETRDGDEASFPGSLMGVIAAVRQTFFDTANYTAAREAAAQDEGDSWKKPEFNPALEALQPAVTKKMRVLFEPGSALMTLGASKLAKELGLDFCLVSSGQEWRRPDLAKASEATFIVPLNFPEAPKLSAESDWEQVRLDQLRAWDWAPENPAVLRKQGLTVALTTYGLADKKKFRDNLRLALDRGFAEEDALAGLTTVPAKLCGMDSRLGTIEAGKLANLTVVTGKGYFDPEGKVREVWIEGRIYRGPAEEAKADKSADGKASKPATPEEGAPKQAKEDPAKKAEPKPETKPETKPEAKPETKPPEEKKPELNDKLTPEKKDKKQQLRDLRKTRLARSPLEGRGPLDQPKSVLIENATIWTSGPDGVITNGTMLVVNGQIKAVGRGSPAIQPEGPTTKIDGHGLHLSAGLIDCHSHTAILGAVNESTLPSTAMVRIRDVVNSETDNIHEQLAGGLTAANLLHGSANPIGGQNCVIKLKDGGSPDDLIYGAAPQGIKFALGENVKQSNWGDRYTTRFPQTRMGVRTFIANRFIAAQQYLDDWENYRKAGKGVAPRRDLELEAIGEILQGKRLIHCHSYRQDEILMLIRLMDGFGVKIATFQHVLEGYKVADEIARHGAGASTFSDWWAYKFEVYDAIPYNGSLLHDRGVVVSFNSDSSELARRLYLEAAKAVKYGGTSETQALKFVTLNPAKQLHIDRYIGSLEVGKDADFVVWSKSPLDFGTVCLQTWIEGKKYFDRAAEVERAEKLSKERSSLITKAKEIAKLGGGGPPGAGDAGKEAFFKVSLEHEFDGRERDCLDEK